MRSPFKFLDSYTREDRELFFGRDHEITELYRRVFESKMLLVYGISGTGKSSLVNCGLASRFDESDWLPVNIRRGNNIAESLNEAFSRQALTPFKKSQGIKEKLQSIYLDHFKPVYLLFDQFEELFIFGGREEKEEFVQMIKEITESEVQFRIIFIIREEFLAGMTEFEEKLPDIFTNRFRVEKMKRGNAISAVDGPCRVYGIETEKGFSEELIDKLCPTGNEIELTYLQIYLDRIYHLATRGPLAKSQEPQEESSPKFTKELLVKAGSVSDLLGQFLDEQVRQMDDPETGMSILKTFVSVQGTKRQMTEAEVGESIMTFGVQLPEPDLTRYLNRFVDLRILRDRDDAGHYELRHDAIAAKIFEHFTLGEKELLEVRQFVENAFQAFRTRNTYLNRDDLEYLSAYEKRLFLPADLDQFIKQNKDKLLYQQRALKRLTSVVAVVFLLLIGLGARYYFNQKGSSETKDLINLALLQSKADPLTGLDVAYKAWQKDTLSTLLQGVIFDSFKDLLDSRIKSGDNSVPKEFMPVNIPVSDSVCYMKMDRTGSFLYGWTAGKEIFIYDLKNSEVRTFKVSADIEEMQISQNFRYFVVIYQNNTGEVFKKAGKSVFTFPVSLNRIMNGRLVRFFPSGKFFMASVNGNTGQIYDSTGKCLFTLEGHKGNINSLDISPDGRFVATVSDDLNLIVWNYNQNTALFSRYNTFRPHSDTIWSCEFNSTGKYILTSSADSLLIITSLNGRFTRGDLYFMSNRKYQAGYYFMRKEVLSDTTTRLFDPYKFKHNDACFGANDRVIIASDYSYNRYDSKKSAGIFHSQVLYFGNSYMMEGKPDPYFKRSDSGHSSDIPEYNRYWTVSPDRLMFASVPGGAEIINMSRSDGYVLVQLTGDFPCFSMNNKLIYYLKDRSIRTFPVDPEQILNAVIEKQTFGDPLKGKKAWKVI